MVATASWNFAKGIAIVIEWILLILLMLAWSEVENEICPLMVPEVWTPELGKVL